MRLKVRTSDGRKAELDLDNNSTWGDLLTVLFLKLDETPARVTSGFPPQDLCPLNYEQSLKELGIKNGDTITVSTTTDGNDNDDRGTTQLNAVMVLREMPDDNSCLFSAISYLFYNKSRNEAIELRRLISSLVLSNPNYDSAILGMTPEKYSEWIKEPTHWGGGIELALFSQYFATEIASIDVATGRMDIFGEGQSYSQRVYILYSGIHYDALAWASNPKAPESEDETIFKVENNEVLIMALKVAELARAGHCYTDLVNFTLKCEECGTAIIGESDAEKHAIKTGHANFTEYTTTTGIQQ